MPCVADSNGIYYATEDSSLEKSGETCCVSDVKNSNVEEGLQVENLGTKIDEERENNITCSRSSNSETKIGEQKSENCKDSQEKERASTMVCQGGERCESYGGAREFFLEGAQEFIACQDFFSFCNSI